MSTRRMLLSTALAVSGLALLAAGIYFFPFRKLCVVEESNIACLRAWLSGIGPIIAIVALLIAFRQFSLSRDTAQRQFRAYVGIAGGRFQLVNLTDGSMGLRAHVHLENSGKSPAYEFTTWIAGPVIADAGAEPFGDPLSLEQRTSASILFADGDAHLARIGRITAEDVQTLRSGTKHIFIWGGADYRDVFGVARTFRFYDINGDEEGGMWPLKPHRRGYHAD